MSRHYEACLAPTGVTTTQYSILRYLQREGPTPLRVLADALELERTSLYRALAPLERDGFVSSRTDPGDARAKRTRLEPAGLEKIREVFPRWKRAQEAFLLAVGEDVWDAISDQLDALRDDIADDAGMRAQLRPPGSGVKS